MTTLKDIDTETAQKITTAADIAEATLRATGTPTAEEVTSARQAAAKIAIDEGLERMVALTTPEATPRDRALDLAAYMLDGPQLSGDALFADLAAKFGDLTQDQFERGTSIGSELVEARAAELQAEADALRAFVAARAAA